MLKSGFWLSRPLEDYVDLHKAEKALAKTHRGALEESLVGALLQPL